MEGEKLRQQERKKGWKTKEDLYYILLPLKIQIRYPCLYSIA